MTSLVTINNGKLTTINSIKSDNKVKIISVVGKARTGKSTLMNLLISKWFGINKTIFKMSDSGEHCTNGVDYYYIEKHNIILLDFQGIYLGDSSQDSKLLLLAYLLSDVIIFNENKMLSNNTLGQFEPMLSFIQYIDTKHLKCNPKLIFRIADVNLDIEPTTNMHQMLSRQDDQFQSIRECIDELFDEPFAINTKNLDRSEFKLLKKEDFMGILDEEENGFNKSITKINEYLECIEPKRTVSTFFTDVNHIIQSINDESKIDFKKLDIVLNLANYEILEYISNIDKIDPNRSLYYDIIVDGTQKLYIENLVSRVSKRDSIISTIYTKFNTVPKSIISNMIPKFTDRINPIIEKATNTNYIMAIKKLDIILKEYGMYENTYIFGDYIDMNYEDSIKELINIFDTIDIKVQLLLHIVYKEWIERKNSILMKIKTEFNKTKESIEISINKYTLNCEKLISDTMDSITLLSTYDIDISNKVNLYYDYILEQKLSELYNIHTDNEIKFIIKFDISNWKINIHYKTNGDYISYFIIIHNKYNNILRDKMETKTYDILTMLSKEHERILTEQKGKILELTDSDIIIANNPEIAFVEFTIDCIKSMMTEKYFNMTLKEDLMNVCKICNDKGYVYNWSKFIKEMTDINFRDKTKVFVIDIDNYKNICTDYHKIVLIELFILEFKKYYARGKLLFDL